MQPFSMELPEAIAASTLHQRKRFADAYSVLRRGVEERAFPGAAFGVLMDGQVVALDGVGHFTYDHDSPLVLPGTVYDLASVTKVVAATSAAMLLHDRHLLDLDQPLGEVLPGFVIGVEAARRRAEVTFRMLLAHTSGLPAYARLFELARSPLEMLRFCLQLPLAAPPGSRSEYSDIGFILLGKAIELLAGESLDTFCHREVFAPIGMTATCYKPPRSSKEFIAPTVDDRTFRQRIVQGEVQDENCSVLGGVSGHAGLFSNALDLLRYANCILSGGRTGDRGLVFLRETIDQFAQRQIPPLDSSRALGWDTPSENSSSGNYFGYNSIGHLGYTGTSLWIDRGDGSASDLGRKISIVLLTNRTWPERSSEAIRSIRPAFHDAVQLALKN